MPSFGLYLPNFLSFASLALSVDELVLKNFLLNYLASVGVFVVESVGVRGDFAKELSAYGLNMGSFVSTFGGLNDREMRRVSLLGGSKVDDESYSSVSLLKFIEVSKGITLRAAYEPVFVVLEYRRLKNRPSAYLSMM